MTCPQCHKEVDLDSSYCRFCGTAVQDATPPRQLRRLPTEGQVAGVCAGLAAYFDMDVTLVRLAWIALSIVPGLLLGGVLAYAVAWIFVPQGQGEPTGFAGKRLLRSARDRMIGGVCGGLAEFLGIDSTIARVAWVVLSIYPGAIIGGLLAYAIAWAVVPGGRDTLAHVSSPA